MTAGALPATAVAVSITANEALVDSIMPTHVTQPCPRSATEGGQNVAEATRLEPVLGQILTYGSAHRNEFGNYGLLWQSNDDASVFIAFTSHVDEHRDALDKIVAHPEELIVCQVALSADAARALLAKLSNELIPDQASSVGLGAGGVEVVLFPGHEAVAVQLTTRYGDAVTVTTCPDQTSCTIITR